MWGREVPCSVLWLWCCQSGKKEHSFFWFVILGTYHTNLVFRVVKVGKSRTLWKETKGQIMTLGVTPPACRGRENATKPAETWLPNYDLPAGLAVCKRHGHGSSMLRLKERACSQCQPCYGASRRTVSLHWRGASSCPEQTHCGICFLGHNVYVHHHHSNPMYSFFPQKLFLFFNFFWLNPHDECTCHFSDFYCSSCVYPDLLKNMTEA